MTIGVEPSGERLLRELAPQVLGAVVRRYGDFSAAEDAVQEALLVAATNWPDQGVPENPRAWLIQVAARRMTDQLRAELARRRRETAVVVQALPDEQVVAPPDSGEEPEQDHYQVAATRTSSSPERNYLMMKAARLGAARG